jgi:hypothetical protein
MDDRLSRVENPLVTADRFRKVAGEYSDLAKDASSPFLRGYFGRIAEDYLSRADGELKVVERQGNATANQSG